MRKAQWNNQNLCDICAYALGNIVIQNYMELVMKLIGENDKIFYLSGQLSNVNFAQYSGYITADDNANGAIFYWLI